MRKTTWMLIGLTAFVVAVGCSTKDEDTDTGPAPGGASGGGHTPTPNGVPMDEDDACETLVDAFDTHAKRLGCTYTLPECPGYIRLSGAPECSEYDQGTVEGCAEFYGTFTSCDEFQKRPCHISNIVDSAPNGCDEETDAGVDAEGDAEPEEDADTDAASEDAEVDAENDAGAADAEADAEPEDAAAE